ncbi:LuxR family transcriptional regulator [bacterium]|nr:MAG: LuxR family transcriptional regulator [bacterium]
MKVFNTDMELVTFIFLIFETVMLLFQLIFYLQRPEEKRKLYYLILLILYILYNLFGGLFPDQTVKSVPLHIQNLLAWGSGFLLACYIPYYIYKAFDLKKLRFYAIYGVWIFLVIPFVIFFGIEYMLSGNIDRVVKHALAIPCIYAIICVHAMYRAIKEKQGPDMKLNKEMSLTFISIAPWIAMPILSYFRVSQLLEVLVINGSFLAITVLFFWEAIKQSREDNRKLEELLLAVKKDGHSDAFINNCKRFVLTQREIEVSALVVDGLKYKEIADQLFIAERTVQTHIQKIFTKTGARSKTELIKFLK